MATKVHLSYGSRRFAACDCWTQTSVGGNAARQPLLIAVKSRCEKKHLNGVKTEKNIAADEFYTVWKETLLPTKRIFGTAAVTWVISFVV